MSKMMINKFSETKMVCSSIPLGDALSLLKRMHRSVENIQSSNPLRPLRPQLCAFALNNKK